MTVDELKTAVSACSVDTPKLGRFRIPPKVGRFVLIKCVLLFGAAVLKTFLCTAR